MIKIADITPLNPSKVNSIIVNKGLIYFVYGNAIYTLDPSVTLTRFSGTLARFAGHHEESGLVNGPREYAKFYGPDGLAFDNDDNLIVCDTFNNVIRKIHHKGLVSTWIGINGEPGYVDGPRSEAKIFRPSNIVFNRATSTTFFLQDEQNVVRSISPDGFVSTIVGHTKPLRIPSAFAMDSRHNIIITSSGGTRLTRFTFSGVEEKLFKFGCAAGVFHIVGVDSKDNIFMWQIQSSGHKIHKLRVVNWCAQIKAVSEFHTFPPGLVPLIASFLSEKYSYKTIWSGSENPNVGHVDSSGILTIVVGQGVYAIHSPESADHDTDSLFDFDTDKE